MTSVNAELYHREYDRDEPEEQPKCQACGAETPTECECPIEPATTWSLLTGVPDSELETIKEKS
jgi:hypothetical protein